MNCVYCGVRAKTIDVAHHGKDCYRKHRCKACGSIFYSREQAVPLTNETAAQAFQERWTKNNQERRKKEKEIADGR